MKVVTKKSVFMTEEEIIQILKTEMDIADYARMYIRRGDNSFDEIEEEDFIVLEWMFESDLEAKD